MHLCRKSATRRENYQKPLQSCADNHVGMNDGKGKGWKPDFDSHSEKGNLLKKRNSDGDATTSLSREFLALQEGTCVKGGMTKGEAQSLTCQKYGWCCAY